MKDKNKRQAIILCIVGILTLITLVVGATFAYFKAQGGAGGSSDVNVITATTDLLTFKIDKEVITYILLLIQMILNIQRRIAHQSYI